MVIGRVAHPGVVDLDPIIKKKPDPDPKLVCLKRNSLLNAHAHADPGRDDPDPTLKKNQILILNLFAQNKAQDTNRWS